MCARDVFLFFIIHTAAWSKSFTELEFLKYVCVYVPVQYNSSTERN